HGLVARWQAYGDPIDDGAAAAASGIPETEHLETRNNDSPQQFKVPASGGYQSGHTYESDECCEIGSDVWADTWGVDGTGSGAPGSTVNQNAPNFYADQAGGATGIVWHGWPYTVGGAGRAAIWPGNTYGGDTSFAAGNGPNQPQFGDQVQDNLNIARRAV